MIIQQSRASSVQALDGRSWRLVLSLAADSRASTTDVPGYRAQHPPGSSHRRQRTTSSASLHPTGPTHQGQATHRTNGHASTHRQACPNLAWPGRGRHCQLVTHCQPPTAAATFVSHGCQPPNPTDQAPPRPLRWVAGPPKALLHAALETETPQPGSPDLVEGGRRRALTRMADMAPRSSAEESQVVVARRAVTDG
ncbi:hypothetical protein VFPBJ_00666 [Purpureocillium lilacinum]|uniref:Uncharacterized protein n=1 Tax=Purpureocillium lilacinum TaxID=33203 RepID=A0A179H8N4_PURLI|nr:hypothetical protein VFPBJ_00666 [Purpureocillium lilacinum]